MLFSFGQSSERLKSFFELRCFPFSSSRVAIALVSSVQRILRHSNVSITQKCYIKTMPVQVTDAMAQFGAEVAKRQRIQ